MIEPTPGDVHITRRGLPWVISGLVAFSVWFLSPPLGAARAEGVGDLELDGPVEALILGGLAAAVAGLFATVLLRSAQRASERADSLAQQLRKCSESANEASRDVSALRRALDDHAIVSITDRAGRIIEVNAAFCRISGYDANELRGQDHRILNSGFHASTFWRHVWQELGAGRPWRGEVCNKRKDGTLYWVDSTIIPVAGIDGETERYVSIRFEITRLKEARAALVDARRRAEVASEAKSAFLAHMSHEVRTPLTAIIGFTDLVLSGLEQAEPTERIARHAGIIKRNGEHLLDVVNEILDLAKIEAGKLVAERVATSPRRIVEEVMATFQPRAAARGLGLELAVVGEIPPLIATDALRLRQILINLVGNALKFTERGQVRLEVRVASTEHLSFTVEDTGIGLPAAALDRIFEPFEQEDSSTTRRFGGTGLGLQISRRLARMLGGDITVTSEQGVGSAFTLTVSIGALGLHAEADRVAVSDDRSVQVPAPTVTRLDGMHIMLAEDGPDNVLLIGGLLEKAGARVSVFDNGRLLLDAVTAPDGGALISARPADVILTDIQMPELDGYAMTQALRVLGCQTPILAITAHGMLEVERRCRESGCDDYLVKPIDRSKLIDACATWGRRERAASAA
ncbi:MAG: response regulator [Myxococcales bacterium]|nr:response regulator [Myxococcales bacterium]